MIQSRDDPKDIVGYDDDYDYNPTNKILPVYTALGDSYASGVGHFDEFKGDNQAAGCRRTKGSYPYQFQQVFGDQIRMSSLNFPACAGADTEDVSHQVNDKAFDWKLPAIGYDFGSPDLVSIHVGGNTGGMFTNTVEACVLALSKHAWDSSDYYKPCEVAWYNDYVAIYGLGQSLPELFEKAMTMNLATNQKREVYVLGYAKFYNTDDGDDHCPDSDELPTPTLDGIAIEMNGIVESLNAVLRNAAEKAGAIYVDIDAAFEGHRMCDKDCWFQTKWGDGEDIFHPNWMGYRGIMKTFSESVLGPPQSEDDESPDKPGDY